MILQNNDWPIPSNVKLELPFQWFSVILSLVEPISKGGVVAHDGEAGWTTGKGVGRNGQRDVCEFRDIG